MAGMEKILFDMRFTAKQLLRESSKCEKKQKAEVGTSAVLRWRRSRRRACAWGARFEEGRESTAPTRWKADK